MELPTSPQKMFFQVLLKNNFRGFYQLITLKQQITKEKIINFLMVGHDKCQTQNQFLQ